MPRRLTRASGPNHRWTGSVPAGSVPRVRRGAAWVPATACTRIGRIELAGNAPAIGDTLCQTRAGEDRCRSTRCQSRSAVPIRSPRRCGRPSRPVGWAIGGRCRRPLPRSEALVLRGDAAPPEPRHPAPTCRVVRPVVAARSWAWPAAQRRPCPRWRALVRPLEPGARAAAHRPDPQAHPHTRRAPTAQRSHTASARGAPYHPRLAADTWRSEATGARRSERRSYEPSQPCMRANSHQKALALRTQLGPRE